MSLTAMPSSPTCRVMIDVPYQYRPTYGDRLLAKSEESAPLTWNPHLSGGSAHPSGFGYHNSYTMPYHSIHYDACQPQRPWDFIPGPRCPFAGCAFSSNANSPHTFRQDHLPTQYLSQVLRASDVGTKQDTFTPRRTHDQIAPFKMFSLYGPSFPGCDTMADMFRPRFLLYRNHLGLRNVEDGPHFTCQVPRVDHLDIVKIWRGLSSDKAEELLFWEITFKKSLEDLLRHQLEFLQQDAGISGNTYPDPGFDAENTPMRDRFHYVPISLFDIVNAMVVYYKQHHHPYRWLVSTGNIYKVVAQLVRTHDCFVQTPVGSYYPNRVEDLKIGVRLWQPQTHIENSPDQSSESGVETSWNPGYLSFEKFDTSAHEGQEFSLTPRYQPPSNIGAINSEASGQFRIAYTTSAPWLRWNPQLAAFTGIIPFFSDMQNSRESIINNPKRPQFRLFTLPITVKVSVTEYFDSSVRFEQTVRARVTISVNRWRSLEPDVFCSKSCCGSRAIDEADLANRYSQPMPRAVSPLNDRLIGKAQNYVYSGLGAELGGRRTGLNSEPPPYFHQTTQNQPGNQERQTGTRCNFSFGEVRFNKKSIYVDYPNSSSDSLLGRGDNRSPTPPDNDISKFSPRMGESVHRSGNLGSENKDSAFDAESRPMRGDHPYYSRRADTYSRKIKSILDGNLTPPGAAENSQNVSTCSIVYLGKPKPQCLSPKFDDYAADLEEKYFPWKKHSPRRGMNLSVRPKVSRHLPQHNSLPRSRVSNVEINAGNGRGVDDLRHQEAFRRLQSWSLNNSASCTPTVSALLADGNGSGSAFRSSENITLSFALRDEASEADVSWTALPGRSGSSDLYGNSLAADGYHNKNRDQRSADNQVVNNIELLSRRSACGSPASNHTQWLVRGDDKVDFAQMLRAQFQHERGFLCSDMEDIFVDSTSDVSVDYWSAHDDTKESGHVPEWSPGESDNHDGVDEDEDDSNAGMPLPCVDDEQVAFL
jgi:hypothetical protein